MECREQRGCEWLSTQMFAYCSSIRRPLFFVFKELTQIHVRASVRVHNSKQHTNEQTMQSFKVEMLVNGFRMQARTSIVLLTHTFVS